MVIFLLLALGSAVPILLYRDWALNRVIWFFVWIALATLSRYAAIAFGLLLPIGLAWQAIGELLSGAPRLARTTSSKNDYRAHWCGLCATGILAHCGRHYAVAQRRTPLKLWTGVCVSACGRLTFRLARRSVYDAR